MRLRLRDVGGPGISLEVENEGSSLPSDADGRLFESLWQHRQGDDGRPHFGLGLYIVKLITDFHAGKAQAANLPGAAGGVRFTIELARNVAEM